MDSSYIPCEPTAWNSACCYPNDSCVTEGLCYSVNGHVYRGGCTDSTWQAPECPTVCSQGGWMQTSFLPVYPCIILGSPGGQPHYSCADGTTLNPCAANNFTLPWEFAVISRLDLPKDASSASPSLSLTSLSSSSPPLQTTASQQTTAISILTVPASACYTVPSSSQTILPSHKPSQSATIDAAIGVPLGLLLIATLSIFVVRERKQRLRAEQQVAAWSLSSEDQGHRSDRTRFLVQRCASDLNEIAGDRGVELPNGEERQEMM